ncbi:MAG: hypothetical protein HY053_08345 [Proteobacteria bacterium]|nr:hypothetical protein [Pseudomonadota bacterium]
MGQLFAAAKADFPTLEAKEVSVHTLGGTRYNGMLALEFAPPDRNQIPASYQKVPRFEPKR